MFPYELTEDSFFQMYMVMYGFTMLINLIIGVIAYVLIAISLSRMAKACRYPRPWLAWIPYASSFLLGKLAEISAARFGKKKIAYGFWMVTSQIATTLIGTLSVGAMFSALFEGIASTMYSASTIADGSLIDPNMLLPIFLSVLFILALSIVQLILQYLALHLVFKLFDEKNAILYIVLCLFVSIAMPIVLLMLSRKAPNLPEESPALKESVIE